VDANMVSYGLKKAVSVMGSGTPWSNAKVGLFTNSTGITFATVLADLTEPTFAGYARAVLSNLNAGPYAEADGNGWYAISGVIGWNPSADPASPETCYGFFVVDNAGTNLLAAGLFPAPFTFRTAADLLTAILLLRGSFNAPVQARLVEVI